MNDNQAIMDKIMNELAGRTSANCIKLMEPKIIEYIEGKILIIEYPVLDIFLNMRGSMQGGFICAAFDNAFGILGFLATGQYEMASVDLTVSFHRPVFPDNGLKITAYLKHQGSTIIHLIGEAHDNNGKLLASSSTDIMLLDKDKFYRK